MVGRTAWVARHQPSDELQPYERLLGDAIDGDPELFTRADAVEESWRIVDPVLGNMDVQPRPEVATDLGATRERLVGEREARVRTD